MSLTETAITLVTLAKGYSTSGVQGFDLCWVSLGFLVSAESMTMPTDTGQAPESAVRSECERRVRCRSFGSLSNAAVGLMPLFAGTEWVKLCTSDVP
jgi:hypothetical protein